MPFIAETSFHIRYAETDAMGVAHHASYIVWFEEGRSSYIRQRGTSYAALERSGYYLAVAEVNARYIKAAHYDNCITIRTWLEEIRSRTLTFAYEIVSEADETLATGKSKHVCLNHDGAVVKMPASWRGWLGIGEN